MARRGQFRAVGRGRPPTDAAQRRRARHRGHRRRRLARRRRCGGRRCWRWSSSLALIVGVNYANDYSDGIRGTDDVRAGPLRLVGSRLASPRAVLTAAVVSLGVGAAAGLALAHRQPTVADRGRRGVHRGRVAVHRRVEALRVPRASARSRCSCSSASSQCSAPSTPRRCASTGSAPRCAVATGALSSAVLVANNLRDIPTDTESGKITLAVRLGDARTRAAVSAAGRARLRADAGADAGDAVVRRRPGGATASGAGRGAGAHGLAAAGN